jgi:hypothetical protein
VIDHARAPYPDHQLMIGVGDVERVDADLNAGVIACPGCGVGVLP